MFLQCSFQCISPVCPAPLLFPHNASGPVAFNVTTVCDRAVCERSSSTTTFPAFNYDLCENKGSSRAYKCFGSLIKRRLLEAQTPRPQSANINVLHYGRIDPLPRF